MARQPKITFIGAGSTVFMKNIVGDVLQRPALAGATIALMDINPQRLEESEIVAGKLVDDARRLGEGRDLFRPAQGARRRRFRRRRLPDRRLRALHGHRFRGAQEIRPAPDDRRHARRRRHHARPAHRAASVDRSARTCCRSAPMRSCCNTSTRWRSTPGRSPRNTRRSGRSAFAIRCRARPMELARDLDIPVRGNPLPRRRHQPHGVLPQVRAPPARRHLTATSIRISCAAIARAAFPKPSHWNPRCPNKVRYEMLTRLGYFVTESSEHFAEYTPYFIKDGRPDLIEKFGIPLDEYPKRCVEQVARWKSAGRQTTARPTRSRSARATNMPPRS